MRACEEFEDRLVDYAELPAADRAAVDAHVAGCGRCHEFLAVLAELDTNLDECYAGIESPARLRAHVRRVIRDERRPSMVPEVLDFAGWTAVVIAVGALVLALPAQAAYADILPFAALPLAAVAAWAGIRSYAELRS